MALSVHFTLFFCLLLFSDVEPNSVVFYANNTLRIEGNRFSITLPPSPISLIVKRNVTTISTNRSHSHNCDIIVTWWRLICETCTTRCRRTPEPRSKVEWFLWLVDICLLQVSLTLCWPVSGCRLPLRDCLPFIQTHNCPGNAATCSPCSSSSPDRQAMKAPQLTSSTPLVTPPKKSH